MAEISRCVYGSYYIPALLRLQDQVPLVSLVSLTMVAMKYCLSMCLTLLLLSTLEIISLLQRALPSSLAGCTTFWQTQVCACVCMYEVPVCVPVNVWVGRQTCVHTCVHVCVRTWVCTCMHANLSCVPLITTICTRIVLVHCTYRCCCCYCILPNWVTCRHTSHRMAIWSQWYRFMLCS